MYSNKIEEKKQKKYTILYFKHIFNASLQFFILAYLNEIIL